MSQHVRGYKKAAMRMGLGDHGWENLFYFNTLPGQVLPTYRMPYSCFDRSAYSGDYGLEFGNGDIRVGFLGRDEFFEQLQAALLRVRVGGRLGRRVIGMGRFLPCGYRLWSEELSDGNVMILDLIGGRAGFLLNLERLSLERI